MEIRGTINQISTYKTKSYINLADDDTNVRAWTHANGLSTYLVIQNSYVTLIQFDDYADAKDFFSRVASPLKGTEIYALPSLENVTNNFC